MCQNSRMRLKHVNLIFELNKNKKKKEEKCHLTRRLFYEKKIYQLRNTQLSSSVGILVEKKLIDVSTMLPFKHLMLIDHTM